MALITCPECGQSISDKATSCPHCGFPLQSMPILEDNFEQPRPERKRHRKSKRKIQPKTKILLVVMAILLSIAIAASSLWAYINRPKDESYLYEWMTENATLSNGSILRYTDTDSKGNRFTLIYDPSRAKQARWYIDYENSDKTSFKRSVRNLSLFDFDASMRTYITVVKISDPEKPTTEMPFWHNVADFTRNSPVVLGDPSEYGTTDWWGITRTMCEDYAQPDLCVILDWLKNDFCPTANMKMSDFGYDSYK